jgi:YidC/Oxa1 family membrane protein insertase
MMDFLTTPVLALLIQSNDFIANVLGQGGTLPPDSTAYQDMFGQIARIFLMFVVGIAGVIHNYGFAIIITAILVRVALLPLTIQQIRGMRNMQLLQPVMKAIQRFYPDKSDQNAKTMELYQEYKINPLSGCLPMVFMMLILFGVYRALYDPLFAGKSFLGIQLMFPVNVTSGRSFGVGPELQDIIDITVARLDLHHQLFQIPQNIPLIGGSFWYLPALGLVVIYIVTTLLMQRIIRKANQPDQAFVDAFKTEMNDRDADKAPEPQDMAAQMQKQMGIFNLMIIVFAFIFSAGALLYFIVQNTLMILEYKLIPAMPSNTPKLDPHELKAFIKRPPPPLPNQAPAAKRSEKAKAAEPVKAIEPAKTQAEPEAASGDDAAQLKRPQRKKRKR